VTVSLLLQTCLKLLSVVVVVNPWTFLNAQVWEVQRCSEASTIHLIPESDPLNEPKGALYLQWIHQNVMACTSLRQVVGEGSMVLHLPTRKRLAATSNTYSTWNRCDSSSIARSGTPQKSGLKSPPAAPPASPFSPNKKPPAVKSPPRASMTHQGWIYEQTPEEAKQDCVSTEEKPRR
jgi:hypothetical protein